MGRHASKLLILDEPTRGIDIGAKKDIYDLMNELTAKGFPLSWFLLNCRKLSA